MLTVYNILQILVLVLFFPFLSLFVLCRSKYRSRFPARLGFTLRQKLQAQQQSKPRFWIHALSVGEVTSAVPLIIGLRNKYKDCCIIVSVTTRNGKTNADKILNGFADCVIDGPLDLYPVVAYFLKKIQPSLFILVETDFWPNLLFLQKKHRIPTVLVNGRISRKAMKGYRRFSFFFQPMFQSFSLLSMQTAEDRNNMISLGITTEKTHTLGNLKFDTKNYFDHNLAKDLKSQLPSGRILFICGSTHPGEEEILLQSYLELRKRHPELFLILAPREPKRATSIATSAQRLQLKASFRHMERTKDTEASSIDFFILNSIGELGACYALCDIGFVGGSLVNKGGHNPLEPAAMSLPVLFGSDMSDFSEIATALINAGGAFQVQSGEELIPAVSHLVADPDFRKAMGRRANSYITEKQGVIKSHLQYINRLL